MKWIKHDTDANHDARLQNVLLDYGLEGYGLYWYCIELIGARVDKDNTTFELEHSSRIIAKNTGSTEQRVSEMMAYFIKLGLFEHSGGVVTCLKLARRLDKSMTSNKEMRAIIDQFKENIAPKLPPPDQHQTEIDINQGVQVMTESDKPMQEEKRGEETRLDNKRDKFDVDFYFDQFWSEYPVKVGKAAAKTKFKAKCKNQKTFDALINGLNEYNKLWSMIGKTGEFIPNPPHPTTWLNQERWNDEIKKIGTVESGGFFENDYGKAKGGL